MQSSSNEGLPPGDQFLRSRIFFFSALKIHVSQSTKDVLDTFNTFVLEERGEIEMKVSPHGLG